MSKIVWEDDFYDRHEHDEWMAEHEDDLISLGDGAWLQFGADDDRRMSNG